MTRERRAELRHAGGMRFEATTGTGRSIVFGDDKDGNEQSPVEMVTAAIAACSAMDVVSILEKKRQVVTDYTIRVSATQRDEYPQILTEVVVVHEVTGPGVTEAAVRRAVELSATKYCPVSAMLSAGDTTVHHRYVVRGTGEDAPEVEGEAVVTGPFRRPEIVA